MKYQNAISSFIDRSEELPVNEKAHRELHNLAVEADVEVANARHDYAKLKAEMAEALEYAAREVKHLQQRISYLEPDARAYQHLQKVLDMVPTRSVTATEDPVYKLERRAKALREEQR